MSLQKDQDWTDSEILFDDSLPEDKLVEALQTTIDEHEAWWNGADGFNLKEQRKINKNWWLPNHDRDLDLYPHQQENVYIDPRIFLSVETIISIICGKLPNPEVMPAKDSTTSIQLARDLQDGIEAWAEHHQVLDLFRGATRSNIIHRLGMLKLEFDPSLGKSGDIKPSLVDVDDIIVDRFARKGENPRFIAHRQTKSIEDWIAKFPDAKDKIYDACGIKRGVNTQLAKRVTVYETWFTWHTKDGKTQESVAYLLNGKCILKLSHPHWIPDNEKIDDADQNILSYPEKPFFPINNLNFGKHWIDDTTLIEQAISLQKILEKRGRQITQNADDASGGLVLNAQMIEKDDAVQLTGDPQEKIMVDGDVRSAVARITPAPLPSYVMEDKYDARAEIDNVFSTHAPLRGEDTKSKTLGQDVLQHQQDMTRHDDFIRSVEFTATKFYRYVVQMMKVHYTEEHMFRMSGDNGRFNFIMLKNDKIEDGIDIRVKAGSTLPTDKAMLRKQVVDLSQAGLVDPLTLYETINMPDPQKSVERLIMYRDDPGSFIQSFKEDEYEREAFSNIQLINAKVMPNEVKEPSDGYINYYKNYIMSGEFIDMPDAQKRAHLEHLQQVAQKLEQITILRESQSPTEEEINAQNQKEVQLAQQQQVVQGAQMTPMEQPTGAPEPSATGNGLPPSVQPHNPMEQQPIV